jgi:hypothetical protein
MADAHKTEQALNSVEKARNAVEQAQDHPSGQMNEQAEYSLMHAEAAVTQASEHGEQSDELTQAKAQLAEERSNLD